MIEFDITIPHASLRTMTPREIVTEFVFGDSRVMAITNDQNMGLCETEMSVSGDVLDLRTIYRVRAEYYNPQLEILRKLML
jgi:hypothetical protein